MSRVPVEKIGTAGALLAALACPICFPKWAIIGLALGLGVFAPYERYVALAVQALFVVAFIGQYLAFRRHRRRALVVFSLATTVLLFAGYYLIPSALLLQISLAGLAAASVWLFLEMRRCARCPAPAHEEPSAAQGKQ